MSRRTALFAALVAFALAGGTARAGKDPAAAAAAALKKTEDVARVKAADEIARLARYCALTNCFDDARRDYARALAFVPANAAIAADLAKIKGRTARPIKTVQAGIADRRTKALARCAELLKPAAVAWAKADRSDELAGLVALMRSQAVPTEALCKELDLVRYEPYLDWRTKPAIRKLDAGWEYVDGAWLDPAKVAALDEEHSRWTSRWIFADEVHEVHTTMPRRTAKQVLAHVGAYRRFFLDYFTGEWDLVPPSKKLPVILTKTRAEMEIRAREIPGAPPAPKQAAAFYMSGPGEGNPFFVSFEANVESGGSAQLDFAGLQRTFEHELGHQIAFEYSKHKEGEADTDAFHWVVEGLAEFLPNYDQVDGVWTLTHPRRHPVDDGWFESAFGWCRMNAVGIPDLAEFLAEPREKFDVRSYHISATLTSFLLEGNDRQYRPKFVDLIEAVHRLRADKTSFTDCFQGIDLAALSEEFRSYCMSIDLDD